MGAAPPDVVIACVNRAVESFDFLIDNVVPSPDKSTLLTSFDISQASDLLSALFSQNDAPLCIPESANLAAAPE